MQTRLACLLIVSAALSACGGGKLTRDGAPSGSARIPDLPDDAVPRPEPRSKYGNGPVYEVLGKRYSVMPSSTGYQERGVASWYGTKFHGNLTSSREPYDMYSMTAAHKTLPLPSYVRVTNLDNQRSVILRVNDRGPFYSDRIIDLSFAAAKKLGYAENGTARVKVEGIDPHEWWAQQGKPVPLVLASPQRVASVQAVAQPLAAPFEQYSPPPQQHAAAVLPVQVDAKKNASVAASGLYLQVGAFANPDAAELLKAKLSETVTAPVFISSVVRNQQILHRVRLGPINSQGEAEQLRESVRLANLGQPSLVKAD